MAKLRQDDLRALLRTPGRHGDGQGLFFRTLGDNKAYWVFRYRIGGKEREKSIGPYPEVSLSEARVKHAALRSRVLNDKADPVEEKRAAKAARLDATASVPTFSEVADQYIASHEASWKNEKHAQQWRMTLLGSKDRDYCKDIRDTPVDKVDAKAVLKVLSPIWTATPETASRLRGRIEAVLASAQVAGHIDPDRPNPARWKGWLAQMLPDPKKLGERGNHASMPWADTPAFFAKLKDAPGSAAKALTFAILTCARTNEVIGMTFDEIDGLDGDKPTWTVPKERMKMAREHRVPLSDAAVTVLRAQLAARGKNPFVFPSTLPRKPLSNMALAMTMRRLGAGEFTVHGFRSSARSWMADHGVEFEVAEQCLAHAIGNAVAQAYLRTTMVERRRPVMAAWADHCGGKAAPETAKVVKLRARDRK